MEKNERAEQGRNHVRITQELASDHNRRKLTIQRFRAVQSGVALRQKQGNYQLHSPQRPKPSNFALARRKAPLKTKPWCELCVEKKAWCGFDHDNGRYERGREALVVEATERKHLSKLTRVITSGLSNSNRVVALKLLARLEGRFMTRKVSTANDPREVASWLALPCSAGLARSAIELAFAHLGVELDSNEVDALLAIDRHTAEDTSESRHVGTKRLSLKTFVRFCAAAKCYRPGIVKLLVPLEEDRRPRQDLHPSLASDTAAKARRIAKLLSQKKALT